MDHDTQTRTSSALPELNTAALPEHNASAPLPRLAAALCEPEGCIEPVGELAERLLLNTARLAAPCYRPDAIYKMDQAGWPGDWEGRTLLALVCQWNALGTKPAYLDPIIEDFPRHLNARGYLGPVLPAGAYDEQQLSGHNWLVRGLCEYWRRTGDQHIRDIVLGIVRELYLPLRGSYGAYPLDPAVRGTGGSYGGNIVGETGGWKLSTDIGCAFMCLDALSQVYELFRLPEVLELLNEMIGVFKQIDFVGTHMQTHATLSATRGILRLAGLEEFGGGAKASGSGAGAADGAAGASGTVGTTGTSGTPDYLAIGAKIFDLYLQAGMTENYANFNWFGRFDTWTEPCAIVDSMMCALALFRLTGRAEYAALGNRIWYNALGYAQRPNGGYGTDTCVGPAGDVLAPSGEGISEAFWCCTMRGAEGLWSRTLNSVLVDPASDTLYLPFTTDLNFRSGSFALNVRSGLPYAGTYAVTVTAGSNPVNFPLMLYTPNGFERVNVALSPYESVTHNGRTDLATVRARSRDGKKFKYLRGDLLLSADAEHDPLTGMRDLTLEQAAANKKLILFSEP